MGSKERIQRLKEDTRLNILDAALEIVKEDGWQSLSMRKIADKIEYTAPIIYEYFANKEGILLELTRKGYVILLQELKAAKTQHELPQDQLEGMWMAYWDFAFKYKELYQLMYGVDMSCCEVMKAFPEAEATTNIICDTIKELMIADPVDDDLVCRKYFTFWSVVHGLISINFVRKGTDNTTNQHILRDALKGIIKYVND